MESNEVGARQRSTSGNPKGMDAYTFPTADRVGVTSRRQRLVDGEKRPISLKLAEAPPHVTPAFLVVFAGRAMSNEDCARRAQLRSARHRRPREPAKFGKKARNGVHRAHVHNTFKRASNCT
jgi:hypothetical protein